MRLYIILGLSFLSSIVFSQTTEGEAALKSKTKADTTGWTKKGDISVNFSQVSLTNWASGGLNSISGNSFFNYSFNYKKDSLSWDNDLSLAYGIIRQGSENALWIKSDDRIDFSSKLGFNINEKSYIAGFFNFRTQFDKGFDTPERINLISNVLSPAYLLGAVGYDLKPNSAWSIFMSPVTYKGTIVMDDSLSAIGAFGVEMNENYRSELGGYLRLRYQEEIMKNVNYLGKLDLFSNYFNNPENIDINWENTFTMKVNKYLNVNLMTHLVYDHDIAISVDSNNDGTIDEVGPRLQVKQIFGAGFSYKF